MPNEKALIKFEGDLRDEDNHELFKHLVTVADDRRKADRRVHQPIRVEDEDHGELLIYPKDTVEKVINRAEVIKSLVKKDYKTDRREDNRRQSP